MTAEITAFQESLKAIKTRASDAREGLPRCSQQDLNYSSLERVCNSALRGVFAIPEPGQARAVRQSYSLNTLGLATYTQDNGIVNISRISLEESNRAGFRRGFDIADCNGIIQVTHETYKDGVLVSSGSFSI